MCIKCAMGGHIVDLVQFGVWRNAFDKCFDAEDLNRIMVFSWEHKTFTHPFLRHRYYHRYD